MSEFLDIVHSSNDSIEIQKDDEIAVSVHVKPINDSIHPPGAIVFLRMYPTLILTFIKACEDAIHTGPQRVGHGL